MSLLGTQEKLTSPPPYKRAKIIETTATETQESSKSEMPTTQSASNNGSSLNGKSAENGQNEKLDENLYSRQIYALGQSAMIHLRKSSVLISGIGGVGVEIAKNLILGGVRNVTIHDTKNTKWLDLSSQFYLTSEDIGRNRAAACFSRLTELNDSVQCELSTDELTEELVQKFDLTILTDAPHEKQLLVNSWTRKHQKYFISTDARGLFAYIFLDLGEKFQLDDKDGEQVKEVLIEYINRENGDVFTLENSMHGLEDGDYVKFSEVKGMTEINNIEPVKVTVKKPNVFNIGNAAHGFSEYTESGRATQVKVPITLNFKSLEESMKDPETVIWDFAKLDNPTQLHSLWQALYKFEKEAGRSPAVRSQADSQKLKELLPEGAPEIDENLLLSFSFQATGNLQPITSVVGGIASQEAMKAVTHHTTPQQQWLYIDCIEALPGDYSSFDAAKLTEDDCKPRNSRYDGQAAVFGWKYQEELMKQKWFVVGAGAIGCELLKNLALMGVGCSPKGEGQIKITDMDQIEISNLNRQFLFRRENVGSKKSEVAAGAVKRFNPDMKIEALSERVGEDTEQIFSDDFFQGLNGVANALDNVEARRYMDRRCVYYQLPLLESGTLGPKANTQVVYPHLTESYGSSNDPPEKDIPICTLKNFPYEIQHTIQWARDLFEGLFTGPAETANQFLADERGFLDRIEQMNVSQRIQALRAVKRSLIDDKPNSAEDCIKWAREQFQLLYHNQIRQLLHNFPPDQITSQGVKFWSGTKRCPKSLDYQPNLEMHYDFVYSASILRAQKYNLEPIVDKRRFLEVVNSIKPEPFEPRTGVRIAVTDAEAAEQDNDLDSEDSESVIDSLKLSLARLQIGGFKKLTPIDFEKDDDTNHHMEFITAASNLRAECYEIAPADRMKTKQIAGRIIPAIATTTAAVAGLVCVELYKMVDANGKLPKIPIERFKNAFINLALPFYAFSEPIRVPVKKYANKEFTLWDRLEVKSPLTLKQLMDWIKQETSVEVTMMSSGVSLIYAFFQNPAKSKERMDKDVKDVVVEVSGKPIPPHRRALVLEAVTENEEGEDVEIPYIVYNL